MQMALFEGAKSEENNKYSKKILAPQYVPSEVNPNICELFDISKTAKLIHDINASTVSEEEKDFLRKAATRHTVFRYDKIADYYAHASKEMQELMEKSALVIIDFDDAIANGYVRLSSTIEGIVEGSKNGKG